MNIDLRAPLWALALTIVISHGALIAAPSPAHACGNAIMVKLDPEVHAVHVAGWHLDHHRPGQAIETVLAHFPEVVPQSTGSELEGARPYRGLSSLQRRALARVVEAVVQSRGGFTLRPAPAVIEDEPWRQAHVAWAAAVATRLAEHHSRYHSLQAEALLLRGGEGDEALAMGLLRELHVQKRLTRSSGLAALAMLEEKGGDEAGAARISAQAAKRERWEKDQDKPRRYERRPDPRRQLSKAAILDRLL